MAAIQLALGLQLNPAASFSNFVSGANQQLIQALQDLSMARGERFVYIYGQSGTGRSHLLQATAQATKQHVAYIPLANWQSLSPEILTGLEQQALVCLDDIDKIAGNNDWEQALFHCFNRLTQSGTRLLIAADVAPKYLTIQLADLHSRLATGVVYKIEPLSDDDKLTVLQNKAKASGLELSADVGRYLIQHYSRSLTDLNRHLECLDQASLQSQRRLTVPFIKQVLGD